MILSPPLRLLRDLDLLRRMGLFGATVEEVARDLIAMQIRALIEKKFLPLEWTEGEAVSAPVAQPTGDWLTDARLAVIKAELAKGRKRHTILEMLGLPAGSAPTLAEFKSRLSALGVKAKASEKVLAHLVAMRAKNGRHHPELRIGVPAPLKTPAAPSPAPRKNAPIPQPVPIKVRTTKPFSVAARMEADDRAAQEDCPIILDDALEWGRRNGLRTTGDLTADFRAVNEIRQANRLPPYRLIQQRGPLGKLPAANLDIDGLSEQRL